MLLNSIECLILSSLFSLSFFKYFLSSFPFVLVFFGVSLLLCGYLLCLLVSLVWPSTPPAIRLPNKEHAATSPAFRPRKEEHSILVFLTGFSYNLLSLSLISSNRSIDTLNPASKEGSGNSTEANQTSQVVYLSNAGDLFKRVRLWPT